MTFCEVSKKEKLMKLSISLLILTGLSLGQNTVNRGQESNAKMQLMPGTIFQAELTKSIDARKVKIGDEVIAKTVEGFLSGKNGVVVPKGSEVLAHITAVSLHQGESASTLGIAFDKITLKNGIAVTLKATIQAIGAPELNPALTTTGPAIGGVVSPPGDVGNSEGMPVPGSTAPGVPAPQAPQAGWGTPNGDVPTPKAQGMARIPGVSLSPQQGEVSTINSTKHDVKLDSGTQMVLRVLP
jgi:hypothetical protein